MLQQNVFIESNARPGLTAVDMAMLEYKTLSELASMTEEEVVNGSFVLVCDNPKWIVRSESEKGDISYFSNDGGDLVYLPTGKRKSFLKYALSGEKISLLNTEKIKFADNTANTDLNKNERKDLEMANENSLSALIEQAQSEVAPVGVPPMDKFGGAGGSDESPKGTDEKAKAASKRKAAREEHEALERSVQNELNALGQPQVDLSRLQAAWQQSANLIALVSPTDARMTISAVKTKPAQEELLEGATEEMISSFRTSRSSVPSDMIKPFYQIKAREVRPQKAVGAIVRVPAFLKDLSISDYRRQACLDKAKIALETNDTSTVVELVTLPELEQKMLLAGGTLKEAPESAPEDGKAGTFAVKAFGQSAVTSAVEGAVAGGTPNTVVFQRLVREGSKGKVLFHDRNYLPLSTYETVDLSGPLPEDVIDGLNDTLFSGVFGDVSKTKPIGEKYTFLDPADKPHIRKENGKIVSDYITNNAASRVNLSVTAFYDKEKIRGAIELPIKVAKQKADGELGKPAFVKYSCTSEDNMADNEYRAKSALGQEKFRHIVDAAGADLLAPSKLREKFKRSSASSTSNEIQTELAIGVLLGHLDGRLSNVVFKDFKLQ